MRKRQKWFAWMVVVVMMAAAQRGPTEARAQVNIDILHSFATNNLSTSGSLPQGQPLVIGSTLYGVTFYGGSVSSGTVYQISTNGTGFSLLYSFTGGSNGANPYCTLVSAGSSLYGMTINGGIDDGGVIFGVNTNGPVYSLMHTFVGGPSDGLYPEGSLALNGSTLYGMTLSGGSNSLGVIFQINANATGTGFSVLYSFAGGTNDGAFPYEGVVVSGSTLYGTTFAGGTDDLGVVFAYNTALTSNALTILHHFGGTNDGAYPVGPLTLNGSTLYGVTDYGGANDMGTIFKVGTDGTGYAVLHSFSGFPNDGAFPLFGPLVVANSVIYGTTEFGGPSDAGVLFQVNTEGTGSAVLHSFSDSTNDGAYPAFGPLLSGSVLYGVTPNGGTDDVGVVYEAPATNLVSLSTCTNVFGTSAPGVVIMNVTAGQVYLCTSSGSIESGQNGCWTDPNGNIVAGTCAPYTTNNAPCAELQPLSLVGKVGGTCLQLGTSTYFIAPATGPLTLYYNDNTFIQNSNSFFTCITPVASLPQTIWPRLNNST